MADTHVNRLRCAVSAVASSGLGAFTISTASSGFRTFGSGQDGQTFTVVVTEGTAWEVCTGCSYTHSGTTLSRGTLADSSTGSAIAFTSAAIITESASADHGRRWDAASLAHVAGTDANTTMAVNTLYVVDMSAWATADRTYTLPAVAAVGDRIGVMVSAGDDSHELIITAGSGDTLNGVAGGTEWSRVFISDEVVVMRCVTANAAWVVDLDGRIPQKCDMELTTSADGEAANTFVRPTACSTAGVWTVRIDNASISTAATDRITARRAGNFLCLATGRTKDAPADGAYFNVGLYKNAGATLVLLAQAITSAGGQNPLANNARMLPLAADDYLVYQFRNVAGSLGLQSGQSWFSVQEVLP